MACREDEDEEEAPLSSRAPRVGSSKARGKRASSLGGIPEDEDEEEEEEEEDEEKDDDDEEEEEDGDDGET